MTDMTWTLDRSALGHTARSFDRAVLLISGWDSIGTGIFIEDEIETNDSGTTSPPQNIPMHAIELQRRLRNRWSEVLSKAQKLAEIYPDPIQSMINSWDDFPVDEDTWRSILEEPYG